MDLPPSALLGRLQAFLPEMEKANQAIQELAAEGKLDVLDSTLEVMTGPPETQEDLDETDGEEDEEIQERDGSRPGVQGATDGQTIQLDFALGDFDETPIARMEQEMGRTEDTTVHTSLSYKGCEKHGEDEGDGKVEDAAQPQDKGSSQQQEKPKPLIEEI